MKSLYERLKEFNRKGLRERVFPTGYIINFWVFRVALGLCFILLFFAVFAEGFDFSSRVYFHCPVDGPSCPNPYSKLDMYAAFRVCPDPGLCEIETFYPGESFGDKPSFLIDYFLEIVLFIWAGAFGLNHLVFNGEGKK